VAGRGGEVVKEAAGEDGTVYLCEGCECEFTDRHWAEACQSYWDEHGQYSLEIVAHGTLPA
jgi:hypothetical protein